MFNGTGLQDTKWMSFLKLQYNKYATEYITVNKLELQLDLTVIVSFSHFMKHDHVKIFGTYGKSLMIRSTNTLQNKVKIHSRDTKITSYLVERYCI